ncbi:MAG: hypothetical protein ACKVH0_00890, partial [Alphaproteobacteria bacterium]
MGATAGCNCAGAGLIIMGWRGCIGAGGGGARKTGEGVAGLGAGLSGGARRAAGCEKAGATVINEVGG